MPSKLDPHVATSEGAEPQLTALAIVGRLSEKHPEQFGSRQHSIVQRLLTALRKKPSQVFITQKPLGATAAVSSALAMDGSGYQRPDPPTAPLPRARLETGKLHPARRRRIARTNGSLRVTFAFRGGGRVLGGMRKITPRPRLSAAKVHRLIDEVTRSYRQIAGVIAGQRW